MRRVTLFINGTNKNGKVSDGQQEPKDDGIVFPSDQLTLIARFGVLFSVTQSRVQLIIRAFCVVYILFSFTSLALLTGGD